MENKQVSFIYLLGWLWEIASWFVTVGVFVWGVSWVHDVTIYAFVPESYGVLSSGFEWLWGGFWHGAAKLISLFGGAMLGGIAYAALKEIGVSIGLGEPDLSQESENPS